MARNPAQPEMSRLQCIWIQVYLREHILQLPHVKKIINSQTFVRGNDPEVKFFLFTAEIGCHKRINTGERNSLARIPVWDAQSQDLETTLAYLDVHILILFRSPAFILHARTYSKGASLCYNWATKTWWKRLRWLYRPKNIFSYFH